MSCELSATLNGADREKSSFRNILRQEYSHDGEHSTKKKVFFYEACRNPHCSGLTRFNVMPIRGTIAHCTVLHRHGPWASTRNSSARHANDLHYTATLNVLDILFDLCTYCLV